LIIGFSYYYNQLNLNEVEIANNLRKHGGYINGIRPGKPTELYLKSQLKYLTLLGALGLCVIALVPNVVTSLWNISKLSFLGTSIIITVSVINETKEAFLSERLGGAYMQSSFLGAQDADSLFRFSKLGKKSEKGVQG
jgi:preprotein translocase subunit SecY